MWRWWILYWTKRKQMLLFYTFHMKLHYPTQISGDEVKISLEKLQAKSHLSRWQMSRWQMFMFIAICPGDICRVRTKTRRYTYFPLVKHCLTRPDVGTMVQPSRLSWQKISKLAEIIWRISYCLTKIYQEM